MEFFYLIIWMGCAFAGYYIGESKGRWGLGLILGIVLGLIGVLIIAVMPAAKSLGGFAEGRSGTENAMDPCPITTSRTGTGQWVERVDSQPSPDVETRLDRLQVLHSAGLVSDSEYAEARRNIIGSL